MGEQFEKFCVNSGGVDSSRCMMSPGISVASKQKVSNSASGGDSGEWSTVPLKTTVGGPPNKPTELHPKPGPKKVNPAPQILNQPGFEKNSSQEGSIPATKTKVKTVVEASCGPTQPAKPPTTAASSRVSSTKPLTFPETLPKKQRAHLHRYTVLFKMCVWGDGLQKVDDQDLLHDMYLGFLPQLQQMSGKPGKAPDFQDIWKMWKFVEDEAVVKEVEYRKALVMVERGDEGVEQAVEQENSVTTPTTTAIKAKVHAEKNLSREDHHDHALLGGSPQPGRVGMTPTNNNGAKNAETIASVLKKRQAEKEMKQREEERLQKEEEKRLQLEQQLIQEREKEKAQREMRERMEREREEARALEEAEKARREAEKGAHAKKKAEKLALKEAWAKQQKQVAIRT